MAYEPTVWKSGDVVTSAKLNKLENGVAGAGGGVLFLTDTEGTLNKTYAEIVEAADSSVVVLKGESEIMTAVCYLNGYGVMQENYALAFLDMSGASIIYVASSEDGYPVHA